MPGTPTTSGKPYLSIIGGTFHQKCDKDTPMAKHREYEKSDGSKGEKWELEFADWTGMIQGITFEDGNFGQQCKIELVDAIIAIPTKKGDTMNDIFSSFAKKIFNANLELPVTFSPYPTYTNKDGREIRAGLALKQGDESLKDYFYDYDTKTSLNGMPQPEEGTSSKDDWKEYFGITVRKFLIKKLEELEIPPKNKEIKEKKDLRLENSAQQAGADVLKAGGKEPLPTEPDDLGAFKDLPF